MKKALSLFLCLVMMLSLGTAAFASGTDTVNGEYHFSNSLDFLADEDLSGNFSYSDSYFTRSGYEYNHKLAIMTMALARTAQSSITDNYAESNENFLELMSEIGFKNAESNRDMLTEPTGDSIGVNLASKKINDNGRSCTLLAVGIRGHRYGGEWASNFTLGSTGDHQGFADARDKVLAFVRSYIAKHGITGPLKIWVTGYSRAAITANMLAGALDQGTSLGKNVSFSPDDLYCYTFEAPRGTACADCRSEKYWNIHNIINPNDLVPTVSFLQWGHDRFGIDYRLPCRQLDGDYYYSLLPAVNEIIDNTPHMNIAGLRLNLIDNFHYISLNPATAVQKRGVTQIEFYDELREALFDSLAPSRQYYVDNVQGDLRELGASLFGLNTDRLMDALKIFAGKFTALPNLAYLIDSMKVNGGTVEGPIVDVVIDLLMDSLQEAGCAGYDGAQVRAMFGRLVPKLLVMLKDHTDTVMTLLGNIVQILNAHFSEVGYPWLTETPAAFFEAQSPKTSSHGTFNDVVKSAYYYDAVEWAAARGIAKGYTDTVFAPDDICTRGQVASFLYRAAGSPAVSSKCPFVDVSADSPHCKAITWAAAKGIALGFDATHFSPDQTCTRAQVATFIYRFEGSPKISAACPFADVSADSPYCTAITWAAAEGITLGKDATHFAPDAPCTRAQVVTFLYRDMA